MNNIYFKLDQLYKMTTKQQLLFLIIIIFNLNFSFSQEVKIGVIIDYKYNAEQRKNIKKNISTEVGKTLGSSGKVSITDDDIVFANYNTNVIEQTYAKLTSSCNVIVLVGLQSTKTILETNAIVKPTISLGITNPELQGIPLLQNGNSGVDNFSYILTSRTINEELEQFYEVFPFKKLGVLVYEKTANLIKGDKLKQGILALSNKFNASIYPIVIGDDISSSLTQISEDTDAVFLATSYEIATKDLQQIITHLENKKIASYSPLQEYVEMGVLTGVSSEKDATSIYRKLGLMIDDITNGTNAKDLSVNLGRKKQLYFNVKTSRAINFSPSFQTLFTANLINEEANGDLKYGITEILEKAIDFNLGIQVSNKDIELTEQELKEAKSNYLPTINVGLTGTQISDEATNEFIGQSEKTLSQSLSASQLIYSEPVLANIKIKKLLNQAQKYATKQEVNTTIFSTYQLYLNILFAKSNVNIQKENLEALNKNLELAELQSDIGAKNKSDVYRWKSEVANTTQNLIEAQTALIIAKTSLNTFLNNSLGNEFEIKDINLESDLFGYYQNNLLVSQIKNPQAVKKISQYLYAYASKNFPSVQQLEYSIKALERQKKSNNRAFYLPNVSLGFNQSEILQRAGLASSPTSEFSNFVDSFWSVGVTVSYPLFEGNRKNINRRQTNIQKDQLTLQKKELVNNLELSIQNALVNLITSQTNILLSKKSADNAQKNFDISYDLYLESVISIVQFLDAQNAALGAKLNYINSIYNYILSFAELENSIGFFSMLATPKEKEEFEKSIIQSITN